MKALPNHSLNRLEQVEAARTLRIAHSLGKAASGWDPSSTIQTILNRVNLQMGRSPGPSLTQSSPYHVTFRFGQVSGFAASTIQTILNRLNLAMGHSPGRSLILTGLLPGAKWELQIETVSTVSEQCQRLHRLVYFDRFVGDRMDLSGWMLTFDQSRLRLPRSIDSEFLAGPSPVAQGTE